MFRGVLIPSGWCSQQFFSIHVSQQVILKNVIAGGPGSGAPGSVHSGGAGSVPPSGGDGITPKQEPMDTNHMEVSDDY